MKRKSRIVFNQGIPNKYGAKKTVYNGRRYDSKFEAVIARELDLRMKSGEFTEIIPQYKVEVTALRKDGTRVKLFNYICDFRCQKPDGSFLLVEVKGMLTATYRLKKKALELLWLPDNPGYDFEEVKQD